MDRRINELSAGRTLIEILSVWPGSQSRWFTRLGLKTPESIVAHQLHRHNLNIENAIRDLGHVVAYLRYVIACLRQGEDKGVSFNVHERYDLLKQALYLLRKMRDRKL